MQLRGVSSAFRVVSCILSEKYRVRKVDRNATGAIVFQAEQTMSLLRVSKVARYCTLILLLICIHFSPKMPRNKDEDEWRPVCFSGSSPVKKLENSFCNPHR